MTVVIISHLLMKKHLPDDKSFMAIKVSMSCARGAQSFALNCTCVQKVVVQSHGFIFKPTSVTCGIILNSFRPGAGEDAIITVGICRYYDNYAHS